MSPGIFCLILIFERCSFWCKRVDANQNGTNEKVKREKRGKDGNSREEHKRRMSLTWEHRLHRQDSHCGWLTNKHAATAEQKLKLKTEI